MVATKQDSKARVLALLDDLPESALAEVVSFVEYQRFKIRNANAEQPRSTPYLPTPMGGLLKGVKISDEDIKEARREMWGKYMDDEA